MASDLFPMTLTIPGLLEAGKWRTPQQLATMDKAAQRSALVEALMQYSIPPKEYLQKPKEYYEKLSDHDLVGAAALIVLLLGSGIRDRNWLIENTSDDHRNLVIYCVGGETGRVGDELWGYDNLKLIKISSQWFRATKKAANAPDPPVFGDLQGKGVDRMALGYFQMLFESARTHYLADRRKEAQKRIEWINQMLPWMPSEKPSDDCTYLVKPLVDSVIATKKNLKDDRDYYGHTSADVPLGSMKFYENSLNTLLETIEHIEEKYNANKSHEGLVEQQRSDYVAAFDNTTKLTEAALGELDWLRDMIRAAETHITDAGKQLDTAQNAFLESVRGMEEGIRKKFSVLGPQQLASVMLNLSFMPEKNAAQMAMVGSQALTFGSDMLDALSSVTMDDGTTVNQNLVVRRLDIVGSDVKDLGAAYTVLSNNFIDKGNGIYSIVQDAAGFNALCTEFYNSQKEAYAAKEALETFLRKALYRSTKIDEYNALWARARTQGPTDEAQRRFPRHRAGVGQNRGARSALPRHSHHQPV
jgi:hypothetical protein